MWRSSRSPIAKKKKKNKYSPLPLYREVASIWESRPIQGKKGGSGKQQHRRPVIVTGKEKQKKGKSKKKKKKKRQEKKRKRKVTIDRGGRGCKGFE